MLPIFLSGSLYFQVEITAIETEDKLTLMAMMVMIRHMVCLASIGTKPSGSGSVQPSIHLLPTLTAQGTM